MSFRQNTLKLLEKAVIKAKIPPEECAKMNRRKRCQAQIYDFLDDPDSSGFARVREHFCS